ncbi:hypothetical protein ILYODFUR_036225 [Ilyodon furcidens]|uniref:Uncharacterized protein n=1 Tax=Ilyodon furcidens TaxID=33524 RepID=A0ABV0V9X3_9TELE
MRTRCRLDGAGTYGGVIGRSRGGDPKDVKSLKMNLPSSDCPAIIIVRLIHGGDICMDSNNRDFVKLLEKFELKEPDEP